MIYKTWFYTLPVKFIHDKSSRELQGENTNTDDNISILGGSVSEVIILFYVEIL